MLNLNPNSPFSGKPLSEIDAREGDAWCAQLEGIPNVCFVDELEDWYSWEGDKPEETFKIEIEHYHSDWAAAGPLMEQGDWQIAWGLYVDANGATIWDDGKIIVSVRTPTLAIRNAFIIAATHAKEQQS